MGEILQQFSFEQRLTEIQFQLKKLGVPERLGDAAHARGGDLVKTLRQPGHPTWLAIHIGGVEGGVYQVNRSPLYALTDVQALIAKRNNLAAQRLAGRAIEVHMSGGYGLVHPAHDGTDELLLTMQMAGVLDNLRPTDPRFLANKMLQAISGTTFSANHRGLPPRLRFNGNGNGNGYE